MEQALPDDWCLHHFDHLAPELAATLPDTMPRMRELCPVARSDQHGGFWVVTGYEDAVSVAQNWRASPGLAREWIMSETENLIFERRTSRPVLTDHVPAH